MVTSAILSSPSFSTDPGVPTLSSTSHSCTSPKWDWWLSLDLPSWSLQERPFPRPYHLSMSLWCPVTVSQDGDSWKIVHLLNSSLSQKETHLTSPASSRAAESQKTIKKCIPNKRMGSPELSSKCPWNSISCWYIEWGEALCVVQVHFLGVLVVSFGVRSKNTWLN